MFAIARQDKIPFQYKIHTMITSAMKPLLYVISWSYGLHKPIPWIMAYFQVFFSVTDENIRFFFSEVGTNLWQLMCPVWVAIYIRLCMKAASPFQHLIPEWILKWVYDITSRSWRLASEQFIVSASVHSEGLRQKWMSDICESIHSSMSRKYSFWVFWTFKSRVWSFDSPT